MICNACLNRKHRTCDSMVCRCVQCHPTLDAVCEHGVAPGVHCCNCHSGFLIDIGSCTCFFGETGRAVDRATLAERMGIQRVGGGHGGQP